MNYELRMKNIIGLYLKTKSYKLKANAGFTLIEIMVALSVFTVVMTVALGSLLSIIDANKKTQGIQTLMTNLNYVVDDISRNARTATKYHCANSINPINLEDPADCPEGGVLFSFESTDGEQITYRFNNSRIEKSVEANGFIPITDPNIVIEQLAFYVAGATINNDDQQPRVVLITKGVIAPETELETEFNIQTSVTQRLLDFN